MSALYRTVKKDGWDLEIFVFEDGKGKRLPVVVNNSGTSTCWTDPFTTEQEALDEARMGAFAIVQRAGIRAYSHAPSCRLPF
jgi:hypothetical protein